VLKEKQNRNKMTTNWLSAMVNSNKGPGESTNLLHNQLQQKFSVEWNLPFPSLFFSV